MLRSRDIGARIGRLITVEEMEEMSKGMSKSEGYRLIAAYVRHRIENLRDGTRHDFDAQELRRQWRAERRAHLAEADAGLPEDELATTGD
jgi:hypothetical protein